MKEKLHNRRGATILLALLLLLVATVVSSTVITFALSSAQATDDTKDIQQAYLTVRSAAELFRDELAAGTGYKKTYTVTYGTYDADLGQYSSPTVSGTETSFSAGCFSGLLKAAADAVTDSSGAEKTANISVDGLADVTMKLTMGTDYSITAVFTLAQQDGKDPDPNYCITVEVPYQGEKKGSCPNSNDTSTYTYSDTIQWGTAEFTKGAAE